MTFDEQIYEKLRIEMRISISLLSFLITLSALRAEVREDHKIYVQEGDNVTYTTDSSKDEFWKVANSHSYKGPNGTATINVVDSLYTAHTGSIYEHTGCSNLDGVINIGFEHL